MPIIDGLCPFDWVRQVREVGRQKDNSMSKNKMLIDAAHPEETRVAMVRGNRVDEFDFESEHKSQLRGNIYLAKVTRVEPSLQAAFVDYGGNRHGFLAFSEIHPDYYQIPVADRQALIEAEAEDARRQQQEEDGSEDEDEAPAPRKRRSRRNRGEAVEEADDDQPDTPDDIAETDEESDDSDDEMSAENDGDDVVSQEISESKTSSRRTRRSDTGTVKAKAPGLEKRGDSASGSDVVDAKAQAPAPAQSDSAEPARPRRRTTRRKAADDVSAEKQSEETIAESTEAQEAEVKPRRTRRTKTASPEAETDTGDAATADTENAEQETEPTSDEKPKRRTTRRRKPKSDAADVQEETVTAEADADSTTPDASDEEKPKRRRSRRKPKSEADQETDVQAEVSAEAESVSENTAAGSAETSENDAPAKPRKRRARRSKRGADEAEGSQSDDANEAEAATAGTDSEGEEEAPKPKRGSGRGRGRKKQVAEDTSDDTGDDAPVAEIGAEDALEEVPARRVNRRHYKIQEVIKRRQILLVQVVKEERGNKGAALTTYLSLAGRYSVLMPNTARGGGISRKITNASDRKRLKAIANELDVPTGMGVILRTAGASLSKTEIQRDFEYLMRLWENVRTLTLESTAPCLVYEEGSLIKRSIRDLFDQDTSEVLVAGEAGYEEARTFMGMIMPEQEKNVRLYKDRIPLFAKMGVETQLDVMLQPQVTLKSGGYLVINQTEALVAIDVNSGRATRQHSIEETALQTNLEAADEVARQLRLRDLAGLIVIDFIDMDDRRNNRAVEKRLKEALKNDRARIQVGRISHFGLMEMSRQRIRASVLESTTQVCPTCDGLGHVRSPSSVVLGILRAIEEQLNQNSRNDLTVKMRSPSAVYLLNNKRDNLSDLESRFGVTLTIEIDETIGLEPCVIEKGAAANRPAAHEAAVQPDTIAPDHDEAQEDAPQQRGGRKTRGGGSADTDDQEEASEDQPKPRKRRRRRRKKSGDDNLSAGEDSDGQTSDEPSASKEEPSGEEQADGAQESGADTTEEKAKAVEEPIGSETSEAKPEEPKKREGWWRRRFF